MNGAVDGAVKGRMTEVLRESGVVIQVANKLLYDRTESRNVTTMWIWSTVMRRTLL